MTHLYNTTTNIQANAIDTDYKAESIAAQLIGNGLLPDHLVLKRVGASKRGVAKDVYNIQQFDFDNASKQYEIAINRDGIYDKLPEGIFYKSTRAPKSQSDILAEIARNRQEEFYNRRFFQPLEEEIDRSNLLTHLKELSFDKKNSHHEYKSIFQSFWPHIIKMEARKAAIFLDIIPLIYHIRTQNKLIAQALSLMFEVPIVVETHYGEIEIKTLNGITLGKAKLGKDFTTSGKHDDRHKNAIIKIGPITTDQHQQFYEGSENWEILHELIQMVFPANCIATTEFIIEKEEASFSLQSNTNCLLGINTVLIPNTNSATN